MKTTPKTVYLTIERNFTTYRVVPDVVERRPTMTHHFEYWNGRGWQRTSNNIAELEDLFLIKHHTDRYRELRFPEVCEISDNNSKTANYGSAEGTSFV